MTIYRDRYLLSTDGQRLHYRDYEGGSHEQPPIICLPGLTRNARDFEPLADRFAGDWRIIALDFRGRGLSEGDDQAMRYVPPTYAADVVKMLDEFGIAEAVFIGTSLGGLVTMLMAPDDNERMAGVLLNDIGPVFDPAGIKHISETVGTRLGEPDWEAARNRIMKERAHLYPDWGPEEWMRFTRRIALEQNGTIEYDYDPKLADVFKAGNTGEDATAWPYYEALAGRPVTILRGETSDLLSVETAAEMEKRLDDVELVTVPRVGHTPSFDEPESIAAVERLLERVKAR